MSRGDDEGGFDTEFMMRMLFILVRVSGMVRLNTAWPGSAAARGSSNQNGRNFIL